MIYQYLFVTVNSVVAVLTKKTLDDFSIKNRKNFKMRITKLKFRRPINELPPAGSVDVHLPPMLK